MKETETGMDQDGEMSTDQRWAVVREKLDAAKLANEQTGEMTVEEKRAALKKRAKSLAAKTGEDEKDSDAGIEVVEFLLAHEKYAFELSCIREVYPLRDCTRIPCTPSFVVGVINVRSRILSVIDLKEFFDLPTTDLTEQSRVVILSSDDMEFGVLVDELMGVSYIDMGNIQSSLPTLTGVRAQYLKGVTPDSLVILDGARILQDKRILVNMEVE